MAYAYDVSYDMIRILLEELLFYFYEERLHFNMLIRT
jgi:hypothetical protein